MIVRGGEEVEAHPLEFFQLNWIAGHPRRSRCGARRSGIRRIGRLEVGEDGITLPHYIQQCFEPRLIFML